MRWIAATVIALTLGTGCTAEQVAAYLWVTAPASQAAEATGLDQGGMERLRACESGGDYTAVSRSGTYRGAYQFSRSTWNVVAERHYPWLVGHDPAEVDWYWQDAMAQALWSMPGGGRGHWPHCGRRV